MSSTLLISLDGLQVEQVQEVVQARGINKVIVVGSSTGFNNGSAIAGVVAAGQIKSSGTSVELAVADGGTLALDAETTLAIQGNNLTFLSDAGLASLTDAVLANDAALAEPENINLILETYIPGINANLNGGLTITSNIGEAPVLSLWKRRQH